MGRDFSGLALDRGGHLASPDMRRLSYFPFQYQYISSLACGTYFHLGNDYCHWRSHVGFLILGHYGRSHYIPNYISLTVTADVSWTLIVARQSGTSGHMNRSSAPLPPWSILIFVHSDSAIQVPSFGGVLDA